MRALLTRSRLWLITVASGGAVLVLEGCDATVRGDVLTGVSSAATQLATTFIGAFFQGLINDADDADTVVRAVVDNLPQFFA